MGNNRYNPMKHAVMIGMGTFFMAVTFTLFAELVLGKLKSLILAFLFLLIIILVGIIFDIIGIAATAASEAPLHAKAAKKVPGAVFGLRLVKNADRVASFCNDVVGDICGTVSGALGASLVFQIVLLSPALDRREAVFSIVMTGLIASGTVTGKALGKKTAIEKADTIIFMVGQVLAWFRKLLLWGKPAGEQSRRRKGKVDRD